MIFFLANFFVSCLIIIFYIFFVSICYWSLVFLGLLQRQMVVHEILKETNYMKLITLI